MKRYLVPLFLVLAAGMGITVRAGAAASCISFESPRSGAVVSAPLCTVAVKACDQVGSITFSARYSLAGQNRDTLVALGRVKRPLFSFVWNAGSVPNQLYKGMTLIAEASFTNGQRVSFKQGGVFIANKPVPFFAAAIPFAKGEGSLLFAKNVAAGRAPGAAHVAACWNKGGITILTKAQAAFNFSGASKDKLAAMGVEVCIDPSLSRKPYPPQQAFSFAVPLDGPPFRILYKPVFSEDGSFSIATEREPYACANEVHKEDGKGFTIDVTVPAALFGATLPDSFGCNVVVRLPGENGQITSISWTESPESDQLSPYTWGTVTLLPKPFFSSGWMQWFMSFVAGLLLALLGGGVFFFIRKRTMSFDQFEQTEEEKKLSDQVCQFIDEAITFKELSLDWAAEKLGLTQGRISAVLKKCGGKNFRDYIMAQRIEIAKERLRSSHSSVASIAESCGFKNVGEMEKYFSRICRTTPLRYRKDNQVA